MDPLCTQCRETTDFLGDPLWETMESTQDQGGTHGGTTSPISSTPPLRNLVLFLDLTTPTAHLRCYRWDEVRQLIEQPDTPATDRVRFWRSVAIPSNYVYRLSDMWLDPVLEPLTRYYNTFVLRHEYERAIGTSYGVSSLHRAIETIRVPEVVHRADVRAFFAGTMTREELLARVPGAQTAFEPAAEDLVAPSLYRFTGTALYLGRVDTTEDGAREPVGYGFIYQPGHAERRGRELGEPATQSVAATPITADPIPVPLETVHLQLWLFDRATPVHGRILAGGHLETRSDAFVGQYSLYTTTFDVVLEQQGGISRFTMYAGEPERDYTGPDAIRRYATRELRAVIDEERDYQLECNEEDGIGEHAFTIYPGRADAPDSLAVFVDEYDDYLYYHFTTGDDDRDVITLVPAWALVDVPFLGLPAADGSEEILRLLVHDNYSIRLLTARGEEVPVPPAFRDLFMQQRGPDRYRASGFRVLLDEEYYQAIMYDDDRVALFHERSGRNLTQPLPFARATILLHDIPFRVVVRESGYDLWRDTSADDESVPDAPDGQLVALARRVVRAVVVLNPPGEPLAAGAAHLTFPRRLAEDARWRGFLDIGAGGT